MNEKQKRCIELIKEGYTAKEIAEKLNYSKSSVVTDIAKRNGLKCRKRAEIVGSTILTMRKAGHTYEEISEATGYDLKYVALQCCKNGIGIAKEKEIRSCLYCGKQFEVSACKEKKFCCDEHGRKYSHIRAKNNPGADDTHVSKMLERCESEWEYIGGYTGSEGTLVVRHTCGFTSRYSYSGLKHNMVNCPLCRMLETKKIREQRKKEKEKEAELARFYKPVPKYLQQELKSCSVCGALFYGSPRKKTCSDKCSKRIKSHYDNMKKRRRRKDSWTSESSTITLEKLFVRDKGICWICGGKCDKDVDSNDNMYPSVDHVIPISRGGKDSWDNVKLAHRLCNTLKGAKVLEVYPPVAVINASDH